MAGSVCNIPAFYSEVSGSYLGFDTEDPLRRYFIPFPQCLKAMIGVVH